VASSQKIENWNRSVEYQLEQMRKVHSPLVIEQHQRFVEEAERLNPDLPEHSHRFTHKALHPEKYM
jgi:hypothetical protein